MIITEVHENGDQPDKLNFTESYVETFWRHGKKLLKGASVLGAGMLSYGAWRYFIRDESVSMGENRNDVALTSHALDSLSTALESELSETISWQDAVVINESIMLANPASRKRANNCLPIVELGEFRVNTYTFSNQMNPFVTTLVNGGFVVVWNSDQDGNGYGVYGQRYDANGLTQGTEFRVNTYITSVQAPSVTSLTNGDFVVVWASSQEGSYDVYGQRYDANGLTQDTEFRVNTYTTGYQGEPSVTSLANGGFVVVWASSQDEGGNNSGVYGQRYAANGLVQGVEFRANTYTVSTQQTASVADLTNGGFVVVWESDGQDGSAWGVYAQRYDANGLVQGTEFRVNTYTASTQWQLSVTSLTNGGFVVVWGSAGQDGSGYGVYGQRYDANGLTQGTEFRVNTYTTNAQWQPFVTSLTSGGFVVVWQSDNQDGNNPGVYGQRYDANGLAQGTEFRVNTYTTNNQQLPSVTSLTFGGFVVVWQSEGQDGSYLGVYGQRFWQAVEVYNACNGSYTEDINYPLNLQLNIVFDARPLNATLILQPALSGQLWSSTNPSGATANYNATLGRWFANGSFTGVDSLLQGLSFQPAFNHNQAVTVNMQVSEDTGYSFTGSFALTGIPVNDAPLWINNKLALNQGERRVLTTNDLQLNDVDNTDNSIQITVNTVQYGQFEWTSQPNAPITTFTQQDINTGLVAFAHNGLGVEPRYTLTASDGALMTIAPIPLVDFNSRPNIVNNAFVIQKLGEEVPLTNSQILAIDNDNSPQELLFAVSNTQHGHFEVATQVGEVATTFTQQDINYNLVKFIHDGSDKVPSYRLTVNDGRIGSEPSDATVSFNIDTKTKISYTETTAFKSGVSIGITAVGTLAGFAAWRYRNDQDAKRRRQQSLIANILRTDLNLAGVHDFTSDRGVQLLEAIICINKKLENKAVDVIAMSRHEQENYAHQLAKCLKGYVSCTPPQNVLQGGNIVTQTSRHYYYHKVKPLIKPGTSWLDTDAVKKAADAIAINVKTKLNEQEQDIESAPNTKSNKTSIMMQPLLSQN